MSHWIAALAVCLLPPMAGASEAPAGVAFQVLEPTHLASLSQLAAGTLDASFSPAAESPGLPAKSGFWVRLRVPAVSAPASVPVLAVNKTRNLSIEPYAVREGATVPLSLATALPKFLGLQDAIFVLPAGTDGATVYGRIQFSGRDAVRLGFTIDTLGNVLAKSAGRARMITLAFGALVAVSLAALLIWFVLADALFILYAGLFAMQALYIVYFSGQGFDWPLLSRAAPFTSNAWNVPVALGGAIACLFVREISDLKSSSPRAYRIFGGLAIAFVVLAFANVAKTFGYGGVVNAIGNLVFMGAAVYTVVVSFMAWRRGNRAAGWFLLAWGLLEVFTVAATLDLLLNRTGPQEGLLYYGLPLSTVAAAVLMALGVADRLREQRRALSEAQLHAQTDSLTGVLNRRSLVERLHAGCMRARARSLPIALLFIDLDHFKRINDTFGHPAGDACLQAIIGPIQSELRQSDVIGRYGGEEFVVVLSSADTAAAHAFAARILGRVADICVEGFGAPIRLTCSIGVAGSDRLGVWNEQLIAHADAAVYAAKNSGRNRVQVAEPLAA